VGEPDERPFLACPECGAGLIPASGRGRHDANGNEIRHRDSCRCRWCDWWWDSGLTRKCACGFSGETYEDDGHVYVREVSRG
jgi:hypothetical protein